MPYWVLSLKKIEHISDSLQVRNYSAPGKRGFIGQIIDNLKQDPKTKEMQDELKKFRAEAEKLDQSEALQKARAKYVSKFNSLAETFIVI